MTFIRYQKGMSLKEFRRMMSDKPKPRRNNDCGCDCCEPGAHCLKPPCTRTRNRRTGAQMTGAARTSTSRVKAPARPRKAVRKAVAVKPIPVSKMRSEWFVDAKRNKAEVRLAAPDGEAQAIAMRDSLIGHGWEASTKVLDTFRDDPRFHSLAKEVV